MIAFRFNWIYVIIQMMHFLVQSSTADVSVHPCIFTGITHTVSRIRVIAKIEAGRTGGTAPAWLSAANEVLS